MHAARDPLRAREQTHDECPEGPRADDFINAIGTQEQRPQASNYFERPYLGNENQKGSVEPKPAVAEASHKEDYSSGVTKSVGPSSFTDERLMAKLDNALREVLIFDATHAIIPH